jgi:hypothetical protein
MIAVPTLEQYSCAGFSRYIRRFYPLFIEAQFTAVTVFNLIPRELAFYIRLMFLESPGQNY